MNNAKNDRAAGTAAWPIFHQPWWLDAVAFNSWDAAVVERGGEVVARLPYVVRGPRRMRVLTQPPATQFLGPWVAKSPGAKYSKALGDQMDLQADLEAMLPAAAMFQQNFSPAMIGALPFMWAGYHSEVRYTYRLEDLSSEQALWDGLSGNIRREIRKAQKRVVVRDDLSLERFYEVWSETLTRQGLPAPNRDRLYRIENACAAHDCRVTLFACDDENRVHSVAYIVWDHEVAYYLFGGSRPELRTSGASSLLLWEAILRARRIAQVFDFEGSMLAPVERFFRAFGGRQSPYLHVSRATPVAAGALALHRVASRTIATLRR